MPAPEKLICEVRGTTNGQDHSEEAKRGCSPEDTQGDFSRRKEGPILAYEKSHSEN
jgi:hypothetical protein